MTKIVRHKDRERHMKSYKNIDGIIKTERKM